MLEIKRWLICPHCHIFYREEEAKDFRCLKCNSELDNIDLTLSVVMEMLHTLTNKEKGEDNK
jgi:transcription initiation factor IIE alpha subunit